jgi:RNA polymerase sigma-54 factor
MAKLGLEQGLKQTLRISATIRQSLNILQMSATDLSSIIALDLENNPFLERQVANTDKSKIRIKSNIEPHDFSALIANLPSKKSLYEHLFDQIPSILSESIELEIAYKIFGFLEPTGYFSSDSKSISNSFGYPIDLVEQVLSKLQKLEPSGVFARDLKECLLIQLQELNLNDEPTVTLVNNLDLLASNKLLELEKICKVDFLSLQKIIKLVKSLNPTPGKDFQKEDTNYFVPDLILSITEDILSLSLNDSFLPKITLNYQLIESLKAQKLNLRDKQFIRSKAFEASNLLKFLDQRSKTLLIVANAIIDYQKEFFLRGIMYLRPLTLSIVAQLTGLNESTISRTVNNKYILTPSRTYELKYFFSSALSPAGNNKQNTSSLKVKELIRQIINSEHTHQQNVSDIQIANELQKLGIKIARRTVTKYRASMNIPSSSLRDSDSCNI